MTTTSRVRRGLLAALLAGVVAAGALSTAANARAAAAPSFSLATLGAYGGEPSIISDSNGVLYMSSPSGAPPLTYRSTDKGATWTLIQSADNNSGDTCLGVDQSNALYWCNLGSTTSGNAPLQADVWKSTVASTCTTSCSWTHGDGAVPGACSTSCNPFGVDRQWVDAQIPPGGTTSKAEVVLMYHDFYGPSHIWVNISTDGGATFGTPQEVLSSPAVTPGALTNTVVAEGYTFCNTVPAGVRIVRPGLPHAGRIFVGWIAADAATDGTGCNISMAQAFHTLWVSYSDDNGATWTPQMAYDAGIGHDASTPFVAFTLDNQGNPYLGFDTQDPAQNPAVCGAESAAGAVQSDTSCGDNMYVVWSHDGGATWDDGTGLIPGSAATAYRANPAAETGTDVFPTIAAAAPGQVDVSYLHTPTIVPTDVLGKFLPGGCAGNAPPNPPTYPATCNWNLTASQSANLLSPPASATWSSAPITTTPMHVGDICNLGIACGPTSNRNLLDFNQETIDPTTGCAHISYADDNAVNKLRAANQTTGCFAVAAVTVPDVAWPALLIAAGAVVALGVRRSRRPRAAGLVA
jgi:hypothetical protein